MKGCRRNTLEVLPCPECVRLAAEVDRIRKQYQAALLRLHGVLNALVTLNLKYEKSKSEADRLGKDFDLANRELQRHRRTHLKAC